MFRVVIMYENRENEFFDADSIKIIRDVPQAAVYSEAEGSPKLEDLPKSDLWICRKDGSVVNTIHLADTKEVNVLEIPKQQD
jgi:hypothetical protein